MQGSLLPPGLQFHQMKRGLSRPAVCGEALFEVLCAVRVVVVRGSERQRAAGGSSQKGTLYCAAGRNIYSRGDTHVAVR